MPGLFDWGFWTAAYAPLVGLIFLVLGATRLVPMVLKLLYRLAK